MSATINETLTLPKFGETVRLAIGILIGPNGLALVSDADTIEA